jgi:hypothetical protein
MAPGSRLRSLRARLGFVVRDEDLPVLLYQAGIW